MSDNHIITDENGVPMGAIDLDALQAAATVLGFKLAVNAGDEPATDLVTGEALQTWGADGFGYVAAAALRHVISNIVSPLLDITAEMYARGLVDVDVRDGLRDAMRNAEQMLGGEGR